MLQEVIKNLDYKNKKMVTSHLWSGLQELKVFQFLEILMAGIEMSFGFKEMSLVAGASL
jgi:hypothetical protein